MMGRHTDRFLQLELQSGADDLDYTIPAILDDLEDALIDNFDKAIKSLVKTLNSIHPLHRVYLADQLASLLFADSEFEYYRSKIELELLTVKQDAFKSLEKEGLSDLQLDILIDKIPHSVWQKLLPDSHKIPWHSTSSVLASYIKEMFDKGEIQEKNHSKVYRAFASIFYEAKTGAEINFKSLSDYISIMSKDQEEFGNK